MDRLNILLDEVYSPVDAASELRILPNNNLKNWLNSKLKESGSEL